MKITILMFSALALVGGCSSEKTTPTPVAAAEVPQQAVTEAAPTPQASPVVDGIVQSDPERAFRPAAAASIAIPSRVAEVPVASPTREGGRIGAAELVALIASGEAILVDVRSAAEWRSGHAEGAIHIPYSELFARSVELPHEALIALYCT